MRVLIACEESGTMRRAFAAQWGHAPELEIRGMK